MHYVLRVKAKGKAQLGIFQHKEVVLVSRVDHAGVSRIKL